MAQATSNSAKMGQLAPAKAGAASNQVPKESLLEYLHVAAKAMRRTELSYGIMMWLTMILFVISASVLIDHWVWEFPPLARLAVLASIILWTIWWIPKKIIPPLFHPINTEHAARAIEQQFPDCKNSLISWLQLSGTDSSSPKGVLAYVGRYAVRNLKGQDANSIVDSSTIVRLSAAFLGCLLCGMIYLFASPKSGFTSIARMMAPWADIAPATRVNILEVIPGTTTVTQGGSLPLSVTVRGMHQGEGVRVRFDLSDGQMVGESVPMTPEIQMINYKLDFGKSFGGIHQPLKYWILAGDAVAGPFDVSVQVVPMVAVERIELSFPPYTKLKPRTLVKQGSFETPEGTQIELVASTNQMMKKARLELDPVLEEKSLVRVRETMDLAIEGNSLTAKWVALLDEKKNNPTTTQYRIKATNELNESNPDPILYQVKVIGDLPPEVLLDSSLSQEIDVPADGSLQIEIRANDPDYGLTEIAASGNRPAEDKLGMRKELFRKICFASEQGENGVIVQLFELTPAELGLNAGDQFDFFASATDNRHDPSTGDKAPNQTISSPLRIKIVAPDSPSERNDGNGTSAPKEAESSSSPQPRQDPNPKAGNSKPNSTNDRNRPSQSKNGGSSSEQSKGDDSSGQAMDSNEQNDNPSAKNTDPNSGSSPDKNSSNNSQGDGSQSKNQSGNSKQGASQPKNNSQNNKSSQGDDPGGEQGSENSSDANESGKGKAGSQKQSGGNGQGSEDGDRSNTSSNGGKNAKGGSSAGNQAVSESGDAPTDSAPPSHDAEAFDRINQFRKEQETGKSQGESNDQGQDSKSSGQPTKNQGGKEGKPSKNADDKSTDEPDAMKPGDDKTGGDKTGGDKTGGDKTGGDKAGGDKAGGDKTGGDKTGGDKAGGDKAGGDKAGGDKAGGDKAGGDKAGGDKAGGDKAGGDKAGGDKAGGDKAGDDKAGGDKAGGDKAGGDKAGGDKAGGDKAGGDKTGGDKAGGDKAGGDKAGGDKTGGDKAGGDKTGGDKAGGDKAGDDKAGGDKAGDDKAGGDKAGGDKAGGDKAGDDKAGGDKAGGDKAGGDKAGGDKAGGDKAGGDKAGGDKTGGDKTGGDKAGDDKTGGDKTGGDKTGGDKTGGDKSGGDKSGGDKAGGDKAGGDKAGGDKSGGDKAGGDKAGGDKSGGDKSGGDKSGGDKAGGDKAGADKAGGDKAGSKPSPSGQKSPQSTRNPDESPKGGKDAQPGSGDGGEEGLPDGPPKDGSKPSKAGSGVNRSGKTPESSAGGTGPGAPSVAKDFGAEKANLEYADKTTDMVLEYLDRQRDQPDPELLKKLNWSPEDLRKFSDRWRAAKEQARKTPEKKEELDAALRALGLRSPDQKVNRLKDKDDNLRGMQESGGRLRPPESIREQFEAFRKAAGKLEKSP